MQAEQCCGRLDGIHLVKDLRHSAAPRLARRRGNGDRRDRRGHGSIVFLHGKKVGVYRDVDGSVYAVDIRCPHLGCQLEWNPDEKSWDCPCHGSRFDFRGELISGPAQNDIKG